MLAFSKSNYTLLYTDARSDIWKNTIQLLRFVQNPEKLILFGVSQSQSEIMPPIWVDAQDQRCFKRIMTSEYQLAASVGRTSSVGYLLADIRQWDICWRNIVSVGAGVRGRRARRSGWRRISRRWCRVGADRGVCVQGRGVRRQ
jgi:hypothetical protein